MGMGFWLTEKLKYDPESGQLLSNGTWEYKPPTTRDIPVDLRITFLNNNPNPLGVLGSKCVGEPPLCLSTSVIFAVKHAIEAALIQKGNNRFFVLNSPATVDKIQSSCDVELEDLRF
jgi:xanthine dehydrogenase/oxidase